MIRPKQARQWLPLASLALAGLAALGCGAEKADGSDMKGAAGGTGTCALLPSSPQCRPPVVENPSIATPIPMQSPAGSAGTAAVSTTPATPPPPPARPRMQPIGTGPAAGAPAGGLPGQVPGAAAGSAAPPPPAGL